MTPIILQWVCVTAREHVRVRTFSTGRHRRCRGVFGNSRCLWKCARVSVSACVFKLLFNFYFLFYSWRNPNATQLCSQPEKEGLGDGLPGPGESSHALQLRPTDGREMGLPAWAYLLFVGQTDPTQKHNCPSLDLPITPGLNLHHFCLFTAVFMWNVEGHKKKR